MAWFRCSVGGGGGGETDVNLIVTCSPGFAGSTISCTNGSKTYTQTCPSSSPYTVTFENIEKGTWTISGIASGQTFTKSVTISDYTAELTNVPNGATITPVNDIQIWLHCANIWNKTYTTISQVLSDTSTLLALISSNNAADYMARSTNWASSVCANQTAMGYIGNNNYCANKLIVNSTWRTAICNSSYFESVLNAKVPTMTSNTTPSGVASAHTTWGAGYEAYKAFDNNINTQYYPTTSDTTSGAYLRYEFTEAVNIVKIQSITHDTTQHVTYQIQYSDDGTNWTNALSNSLTTTNQTEVNAITTINTKHKYWQAKPISGTPYITNQGGFVFHILQFYGRA